MIFADLRKLIPKYSEGMAEMGKWWAIFFLLAGIIVLQYSGNSVIRTDSEAEIPAETAYIALTFDDGPRLETTDRLLDGLRARGASATFFLVGEQAALYPDLVRRMVAE